MNEEQARKLAAECAEYFEEDDDPTTVEASYYPPGKNWRIVLYTGDTKTVFHELRDARYIVDFHRSNL